MRILLAIMILCYLLGILLLLLAIRRVHHHAGSIDGSVKTERFQRSIWFWADKKEIPKGSPPDMAGGAGILCLALSLAWLFLSQELVLYYVCRPYGGVAFSGPEYFLILSLIANLAIAFAAADCYTLLSHRPMAIAHSMLLHRGRKKSVVTRNYLVAALVIWALCYPIRIIAVQSYGAAAPDRVIYHAPFHTDVQTYEYGTSALIARDGKVVLINAAGDELRVDDLHVSILSDDADILACITDQIEKNG